MSADAVAFLVAAAVLWSGHGFAQRIACRPVSPPATVRSGRRLGSFTNLVVPRRRIVAEPAEVAAWCDSLGAELRGGRSLTDAVRRAAVPDPLAADLDPVRLALDRGRDLASAVATARPRSPSAALAFDVVAAAARHGGSVGLAVDRVAAVLRTHDADAAERRVHSAQARMSAGVLTVLPVAALAVFAASSPPVRAAVATGPGLASIAAGLFLTSAGWWWMHRTIGLER